MQHSARHWFSDEEIARFTARSDARALLALASAWFPILAAAGLALWQPGPLTALLAVLVFGNRQLALAVLMHEAAHRTLARRLELGELIGEWFAAGPIVQRMSLYRAHHRRHHRNTGTERDPDLRLATGYPVSAASLRRKLLRDLSGLTGLRQLIGSLAMLCGYAEYDVRGDFRRDRRRQGLSRRLRAAVHGLAPTVLCLGTATLALAAFDAAWMMALWLAGYLSVYPVQLRIRALAEHAMTTDPGDALNNSRTTRTNAWGRMLLAPMYVNYHLEHHLLPGAPCYRLPEIHAALAERGAFAGPVAVSQGYGEVLREAGSAPA